METETVDPEFERGGGGVGLSFHLDPACRTQQLHVDLHGGTLEDLVEDLAGVCARTLGPGVAGPLGEAEREMREALRAGLRSYIVGFDVCGLASVCGEAERFDPWSGQPAAPGGVGGDDGNGGGMG